ncbi:Fluconazole resistance protein 3 [Escovopsis weberi]|uniref:Fluconazole resistance protein 3 n=1 Tax=Escovopsis weberi TaxID=150374 RepID=A0A0M8MW52_ESCWE|nr:Fluconazole resistance protein 3 [Escovopsis weberi]
MNHRSPSEAFEDHLSQADRFSGFDFTHGFGGAQQHAFFPSPAAPPGGGIRHGPQGPTPPASDGSSQNQGDMLAVPKPETVNELPIPHIGSEEDDSQTPAQCRRKAQNRAAQRAFRERKEKHIKDLEAKLAYLEAAQKQAANENEQLRQDLQKISMENEILRATSSASLRSHSNNSSSSGGHSPRSNFGEQITTGPMVYKPTDFYSKLLESQLNKFPSHRIITSDDGQKLFAAGATWDYIVGHKLYKKGQVDILKVCDLIKNHSKCDGQGPVFSEKDIESAIEQAVAGGSDDLL